MLNKTKRVIVVCSLGPHMRQANSILLSAAAEYSINTHHSVFTDHHTFEERWLGVTLNRGPDLGGPDSVLRLAQQAQQFCLQRGTPCVVLFAAPQQRWRCRYLLEKLGLRVEYGPLGHWVTPDDFYNPAAPERCLRHPLYWWGREIFARLFCLAWAARYEHLFTHL